MVVYVFFYNIIKVNHFVLLDPRLCPELSYEIESVYPSVLPSILPSVLPSVDFLRIGSLVFSQTYHGVRGPNIAVCDRVGFSGKNPHQVKMTKNGRKWLKNRVFECFKKIMSLVLSGIGLKLNFLWFISILQN